MTIDEKIEQMRNCNHLFIKLEHRDYSFAPNSSDCGNEPHIVKCVCCGLHNYSIEKEDINKKYDFDEYNPDTPREECELIEKTKQVFRDQFRHAYRRSGKEFDNGVFNLISKEAIGYNLIGFNEIEEVYQEALSTNPEGSNEEIFSAMMQIGQERKQARQKVYVDNRK